MSYFYVIWIFYAVQFAHLLYHAQIPVLSAADGIEGVALIMVYDVGCVAVCVVPVVPVAVPVGNASGG